VHGVANRRRARVVTGEQNLQNDRVGFGLRERARDDGANERARKVSLGRAAFELQLELGLDPS